MGARPTVQEITIDIQREKYISLQLLLFVQGKPDFLLDPRTGQGKLRAAEQNLVIGNDRAGYRGQDVGANGDPSRIPSIGDASVFEPGAEHGGKIAVGSDILAAVTRA